MEKNMTSTSHVATTSAVAGKDTGSIQQSNAFNRSVKAGFAVTCLTAAVAVPVIMGLGILLAIELPFVFTAEIIALVASVALGIFIALMLFPREKNASNEQLRAPQQQSDHTDGGTMQGARGDADTGRGVDAKNRSSSPSSDRNSTPVSGAAAAANTSTSLPAEANVPPPPPPPLAMQKSRSTDKKHAVRPAKDDDGKPNPYQIFRQCCLETAKRREKDKID